MDTISTSHTLIPLKNVYASSPLHQKFFFKAVGSLSSLLTPRLCSIYFRITKSGSVSNRLILFHLFSSYHRTLKKTFLKWDQVSKKTGKILSGMKILEKQKARKQAQKVKLSSSVPGVQEIQQQKALSCVGRIIKRFHLKHKHGFFLELLKIQVKKQRIESWIAEKGKQKLRKMVWKWRFCSEKDKSCRVMALEQLRRLSNRGIRKYFVRIVKDIGTLKHLSGYLGLNYLEKVQKRVFFECFSIILNESYKDWSVRIKLVLIKLDKIRKNKLKKGWDKLLGRKLKNRGNKTEQGLGALNYLLLKQKARLLLTIISTGKKKDFELKLSLAMCKLEKILINRKRLALEKLKLRPQSQFKIFSLRLVSRRIKSLISFQQSETFSIILTYSNTKKTWAVLSALTNLLSSKIRKSAQTSFKSIKSYLKSKRNKEVIWKIKFYQLEGLLQHKKEEISLKLKLKNFNVWKKHVDQIKRIREKVILKISSKFVKMLKRVLRKKKENLFVSSFLTIKARWESEKRAFFKLNTICSKQLKSVYFEKFKKRKKFLNMGSPLLRNSIYSSHYSIPKASPSLPINIKSTSKRYGFFCTKKQSSDHSIHQYIDQMIKITPPSNKSSNSSLLSNMRNSLDYSQR